MRTKNGFASVLILGITIVLLIAGIALYGYFQSKGSSDVVETINNVMRYENGEDMPEEEVEISESDDLNTLETELESTVIMSPDDDIEALENDADEL